MQKQTISKMEDGNKDTQDEEFEKRVYDRWFKHLFETVNEPKTKACTKPETKFENTEKAQSHDIVGGFDFVPALRCRGWPKIAQDWIKQVRKWPSPEIVDRIVQEGFHLVVKAAQSWWPSRIRLQIIIFTRRIPTKSRDEQCTARLLPLFEEISSSLSFYCSRGFGHFSPEKPTSKNT